MNSISFIAMRNHLKKKLENRNKTNLCYPLRNLQVQPMRFKTMGVDLKKVIIKKFNQRATEVC